VGTKEKCPKCKSMLRFTEAGYYSAKVIDGGVAPIQGHYSCWCCGYHRDAAPEIGPITTGLKNLRIYPPEIKSQNNYPENRKSLGQPGWLKGCVEKEFSNIAILRAKGMSWSQVSSRLTVKYKELRDTGHASVGNVWRRISKEKGCE